MQSRVRRQGESKRRSGTRVPQRARSDMSRDETLLFLSLNKFYEKEEPQRRGGREGKTKDSKGESFGRDLEPIGRAN